VPIRTIPYPAMATSLFVVVRLMRTG
jgi:hypothetical protein